MNKSKANLPVVSTLLFASIPRMDKAVKRQMLSLISVLVSSMFVLMPFAPAVSAAGPVTYTINKTVIDVAGQGSAGNVTKAGDIISYQVNVANDGNLNFTNVNVTDSLINLTGPVESNSNDSIFEAGENWTYTGNYTVTQGDVNNNGTIGDGLIVNNATVNCDNNGLQNDSVQVSIEQNANCTIDKTVIDVAGKGPAGNVTAAGDIVSYQVNVTNSGNIDLANVTVTDPLIGNLTGPTSSINNDTLLNVGESWIYTGNYTITRADITNNDGNGLVNNATINCDQLGPKNGIVQVPIEQNANCTIDATVKDVAGKGPAGNVTAAGDIVSYQVNVTNSGNIDLANVTVTDPLIGNLTGPTSSINNDTLLNVGESWIYTGNYTVTRADITNNDGNGLVNNATFNCDQLGPKNDTVIVPIDPYCSIDATVTDVAGKGPAGNVTAAGDIVSYQVNVTNSGNIDLTNVTVADPLIGNLTAPISTINNDTVLSVGEIWIYTGNYTVTRADITNNDGNGLVNNATFSCDQLGPKNDTVLVPIDPYGSIDATVTDVAGKGPVGNVTATGDIVSYQVNVTNSGKIDLTNVTVVDPLIGNFTVTTSTINNDTFLNAGETWIYTGNYTVTRADITNNDGNGLVNNATFNCDQLGPKNDTVLVPIDPYGSINATVTDVAGKGPVGNVTATGDIVSYQVNVTNSGKIDLTNVTVIDPLIGNFTGNNDTVLNVGETWIYTGNHTVTRADITNNDGNGLVNNATFNCDQLGPKNDTVLVPIDTAGSINEIVTDVAGQGSGGNVTGAGDVINYQVNVTNDGKTDLTNATITNSLMDELVGPTGDDVGPGVLNPGETWTYTGNYTVTQADINNDGTAGNGVIENTASINFDQLGPKSHSTEVPIKRNPDYTVLKSVINPDASGDCIVNSPGDEIPYRIVVNNDGNVDLTGILVNDPMISLTGPIGDDDESGILNPGETWVYDGIYKLTQDDINNGNGYLDNLATVNSNELPEIGSDAIQPIDQKADLAIQKSILGIDEGGDFMINEPGDVINYQIAVENNGDIDLHNIHVTDSLINDLSGPTGDGIDPGVLNPGESWVYRGDYTVAQADIDSYGDGSGLIMNTATVNCNELTSKSSSIQLPIIPISSFGTDTDDSSAKGYPVADFSTSATSGYAPLTVQFTDKSQNAAAWSWDFNNDGVADSSEVNPAYIYTNPGTYTVNLIVSNANGTDSEAATINVLKATSAGGSSHSGGGSAGNAVVSSGSIADISATANVTQPENNTSGLEQNNGNTAANVGQTPEEHKAPSTPAKQSTKTPGFEIISGIVSLFAVFLYRRKQK